LSSGKWWQEQKQRWMEAKNGVDKLECKCYTPTVILYKGLNHDEEEGHVYSNWRWDWDNSLLVHVHQPSTSRRRSSDAATLGGTGESNRLP